MFKRLGIFCTYDSEGVIDEYIIFLLKDIKKVLTHLMIVCNGNLTPESQKRLKEITDDLFIRENIGFDMEAWRQGILQKNLSDYDELVLFNDSFYGPFYSFTEIFDEMDKKNPEVDFWGLTIHGKTEDKNKICPYGYIPEHIQSYFLVIREKMFHSSEFINYWKDAEVAKNFDEAIKKHEAIFTKNFFDMGYKYAAYCDTRKLEEIYDVNIDHTLFNTEKLLADFKCPILKKKVFMTSRVHSLLQNYGDEPCRALRYVQHHTNYDINLIWQNLLRIQNISVTKNYLGLNYILSDKISMFDSKEILKKTVIVAHLYYEDLMPECVKHLCNAPPEISIIVTVGSEEKKLKAENLFKAVGRNVEVRLVSNRGRDLSALLVGCADAFSKYKYLCFIHDKKSVRPNESMVIGNSFFRLLWENSLSSENYIKNILSTFESEPKLGVLVPPPPYNGEYKFLFFIAKFWSGDCYKTTVELAKNLGIPTHFISTEYAPVSLGSAFWCRTAALTKITNKNWQIEDFPEEPMPKDGTISHALERIFPFAAQTLGFYSGWIMNEEFARNEVENFIQFSFNPYQYIPLGHLFQCFKISIKSKIPKPIWSCLKFFNRICEKFGFRI